MEGYHTIAETVGGVPNLRLKDNLLQGAIVLVGVISGAVGGLIFIPQATAPTAMAALIGALLGFIVFGILSGIVLMIMGWVRHGKKLLK